MRKEEFDNIVRKQPFQPFVVRLVDGRVYRFTSPEQFIVTRSAILTLDEEGDGLLINLALVATVHIKNGSRRGRKA